MQHVIVGAGPAGVIAAEALRKIDPSNAVKLVGDEPEQPYSRMAIPYLLVDNIAESGTYLRREPGHYDLQGIEVLNDRVTGVDSKGRSVALKSGGSLSYDRLLVCTGSTPVKPPVPGMDLDGVHNCWTLEDARNIIKLAQPGAKVVLIGAGFIGCIILESLASRKVELTVVEMGDRMVPRMMDEIAGNMLKRWCESKGINVFTSTSVTGVEPAKAHGGGLKKVLSSVGIGKKGEGHRFSVSLSNGQTIDADLVISAAGVKPNVEFLDGSGVEIDRGIMVNHFLQTSVPEIYAAGDCAQGRDFSTGDYDVHAIQPTASEHGRTAAQNMAGNETYYPGSFNMNVLDTVGLISSSFGLWMGSDGGESTELVDEDGYRYINLQFKDDVMVGANSLGFTQHVGVLRGLIQGKVPLGPWKAKLMADPSRVMEAYLATNYTAQHAA